MANMADAGPAALLDEARQRIGQDILGGATAAGALAHFTAYVDRETRRFAANGPAPPAALIALGGYGRKHLCPYTAIELLNVFGKSIRRTACTKALKATNWVALKRRTSCFGCIKSHLYRRRQSLRVSRSQAPSSPRRRSRSLPCGGSRRRQNP